MTSTINHYDFKVENISPVPKAYQDNVRHFIVRSSNNERDVKKFCTGFLCKALSKEFVEQNKKIERDKGNRVSKWDFEAYIEKFEEIEKGVFEYKCIRPNCE